MVDLCAGRRRLAAALSLVAAMAPTALAGSTLSTSLLTRQRASLPVFATFAPGDPDHLFVVEQQGRIRVFDFATGLYLIDPFLDIRSQVVGSGNDERGLLGLAFHPEFQSNGQFYTYSSEAAFAGGNHASYVRRFEVSPADPLVADAASQATLLRFTQPQSNHNGGWIGFGPHDGHLYIATGDGGAGNDNGGGHTAGIGNSQDISDNLLGKMLRIDVDGDDFPTDPDRNYAIPGGNPFVGVAGDDEIFAYGLRNPFRASFDRATGDLYIGDVGQNAFEEIDFIAAESPGGQNFGWRLREGFQATPTGGVGGPRPPDNVDPIHDYSHNGGGRSVTGGYVYRGPVQEIQGHYFFADFITSQIVSFRFDGQRVTELADRTDVLAPTSGRINQIASFAEDALGNLYLVSRGGSLWRIDGASAPGDFNRDGKVNGDDLDVWVENFGATSANTQQGDLDGDGDVDGRDFLGWQANAGTDAMNPAAATATVLPEPSSAALLGTMMLTALLSRRASARVRV